MSSADAESGAAVGGGGIINAWLDEYRHLYERATKHPFVLSIRDGTVDITSFRRWLEQDYVFVRQFVLFVASVLLKSSKCFVDSPDMEVILNGLASLQSEILWFKKEASRCDVSLTDIVPQLANQNYCRFLQSLILPEIDYTITIVAFWAIETVYQESFSLCLKEGSNTPAELLETCQRWGNASFGQYCGSLREIADRCIEEAPLDIVRRAKEAFFHVLEHEVDFWNMSYGKMSTGVLLKEVTE